MGKRHLGGNRIFNRFCRVCTPDLEKHFQRFSRGGVRRLDMGILDKQNRRRKAYSIAQRRMYACLQHCLFLVFRHFDSVYNHRFDMYVFRQKVFKAQP